MHEASKPGFAILTLAFAQGVSRMMTPKPPVVSVLAALVTSTFSTSGELSHSYVQSPDEVNICLDLYHGSVGRTNLLRTTSPPPLERYTFLSSRRFTNLHPPSSVSARPSSPRSRTTRLYSMAASPSQLRKRSRSEFTPGMARIQE